MDWLSDPKIWLGLLTLTSLEIVLGIDNIVFISILSGKLQPERRSRARRWGLTLALVTRVGYRRRPGETDEWNFDNKPLALLRSGERLLLQRPTADLNLAT